MASDEELVTHEEVWDDTALVSSWNDALEEYKKYHSIHSKGGNVDDLNKTTTTGSDAKDEKNVPEKPGSHGETDTQDTGDENAVANGRDGNGNAEIQHSLPSTDRSAFIPAPLLGSVRDEGAKKLLMSWYYAGYYTGYHEGQRKDSSQQQ